MSLGRVCVLAALCVEKVYTLGCECEFKSVAAYWEFLQRSSYITLRLSSGDPK